LGLIFSIFIVSTLAAPHLVTYWASWEPSIEPYTPRLKDVPAVYDVIDVAFAIFTSNGGVEIDTIMNPSQFMQDMQYVHSRGQKVFLSVGGATCDWTSLSNPSIIPIAARNVATLVSQWGFDGVDLDDEMVNDLPGEQTLISFVKALKSALPSNASMISLTPQDVYIYNVAAKDSGGWNTYENVLNSVGNVINWVQIMAYNNGLNATQDYITWASGFTNPVVSWGGFPPQKLLLGLLSAPNAGSSGYLTLSQAKSMTGTLKAMYPTFGGLMTWCANADQGGVYSTGLATCLYDNHC